MEGWSRGGTRSEHDLFARPFLDLKTEKCVNDNYLLLRLSGYKAIWLYSLTQTRARACSNSTPGATTQTYLRLIPSRRSRKPLCARVEPRDGGDALRPQSDCQRIVRIRQKPLRHQFIRHVEGRRSGRPHSDVASGPQRPVATFDERARHVREVYTAPPTEPPPRGVGETALLRARLVPAQLQDGRLDNLAHEGTQLFDDPLRDIRSGRGSAPGPRPASRRRKQRQDDEAQTHGGDHGVRCFDFYATQ